VCVDLIVISVIKYFSLLQNSLDLVSHNLRNVSDHIDLLLYDIDSVDQQGYWSLNDFPPRIFEYRITNCKNILFNICLVLFSFISYIGNVKWCSVLLLTNSHAWHMSRCYHRKIHLKERCEIVKLCWIIFTRKSTNIGSWQDIIIKWCELSII